MFDNWSSEFILCNALSLVALEWGARDQQTDHSDTKYCGKRLLSLGWLLSWQWILPCLNQWEVAMWAPKFMSSPDTPYSCHSLCIEAETQTCVCFMFIALEYLMLGLVDCRGWMRGATIAQWQHAHTADLRRWPSDKQKKISQVGLQIVETSWTSSSTAGQSNVRSETCCVCSVETKQPKTQQTE